MFLLGFFIVFEIDGVFIVTIGVFGKIFAKVPVKVKTIILNQGINAMRKEIRVQTKGNQRGFTLIELMIVVTIIGILASLAIPAYKDNSIRAKVSEAASIFKSVKAAYTLHYSEQGALPTNLTDVKNLAPDRNDFEGDYIRWLQIQGNGRVRVRTKNIASLGPAGNKILEFRPVVAAGSGTINWSIFTRANNANWIPTKYLPAL